MTPSTSTPIHTAHLFPKLDAMLIELLESLHEPDWERPTLAPQWTVKQVAAHLLDTGLRRLSGGRDGYRAHVWLPTEDLVTFVNRLNHEGVEMYSRLSPRVLIALMKTMCADLHTYLASLDPFGEGLAVSWAGEERSAHWFDIAREFTERWHHQQQIRMAVAQPGIMTCDLYHPVLETFMRALPYHYRTIDAATGTLAVFDIVGDCGGTWFLQRESDGWALVAEPRGNAATAVSIPQDIAWRVFTKGISRQAAAKQTTTSGDARIASHVLTMLSIVG